MKEAGAQKTELELRTLLGCFLFSGDDVEKKIKVLSGGEKARVALAKTMISKANFLLLDEPTNHLDLHSTELLIVALNRYQGSFILVSHDRYFISKTANKIWEIIDYQIKEFKGPYEEYVEWKERSTKSEVKNSKADDMVITTRQAVNKKVDSSIKSLNESSKTAIKELQKQQRIFQQLEEKIATLNIKKTGIEASLGDSSTYSDRQKFLEVESVYKKIEADLKDTHIQYEQVFEKIMNLEKQIT